LKTFRRFALAVASLFVLADASAAIFSLSFEGLRNDEQILEFYNGGTGSMGSSGPNFGVSFGSGAQASIKQSAGGTGSFSNNPSGTTAAIWLTGGGLLMNVPAGFDTGFSFYYSSNAAANVVVYDGVNGTGNILATIPIAGQRQANGCSDSNFCNWSQAGASFSGVARSVNFGGTANQTGYDNITFGTSEPTPPPISGAATVPTLSEWGLLLLMILLGLAAWSGRRRLS
jgi:hypothetical protein